MCDCGTVIARRQGELNKAVRHGVDSSCGDDTIHRRIAAPTYSAVHARLAADLGPAKCRECVDCGSGAEHWSYDHTDPNELASESGPFSIDLGRYKPRCVPCHKAFDLSYA